MSSMVLPSGLRAVLSQWAPEGVDLCDPPHMAGQCGCRDWTWAPGSDLPGPDRTLLLWCLQVPGAGRTGNHRAGSLQSPRPACSLSSVCGSWSHTRSGSVWGPRPCAGYRGEGTFRVIMMKILHRVCLSNLLNNRIAAVKFEPHSGILRWDLQPEEPEDIRGPRAPDSFWTQRRVGCVRASGRSREGSLLAP